MLIYRLNRNLIGPLICHPWDWVLVQSSNTYVKHSPLPDCDFKLSMSQSRTRPRPSAIVKLALDNQGVWHNLQEDLGLIPYRFANRQTYDKKAVWTHNTRSGEVCELTMLFLLAEQCELGQSTLSLTWPLKKEGSHMCDQECDNYLYKINNLCLKIIWNPSDQSVQRLSHRHW